LKTFFWGKWRQNEDENKEDRSKWKEFEQALLASRALVKKMNSILPMIYCIYEPWAGKLRDGWFNASGFHAGWKLSAPDTTHGLPGIALYDEAVLTSNRESPFFADIKQLIQIAQGTNPVIRDLALVKTAIAATECNVCTELAELEDEKLSFFGYREDLINPRQNPPLPVKMTSSVGIITDIFTTWAAILLVGAAYEEDLVDDGTPGATSLDLFISDLWFATIMSTIVSRNILLSTISDIKNGTFGTSCAALLRLAADSVVR